MVYSNRIWLYGPFGLLLLLAVLYTVFWRVEADMLAARLDRANGGEIMPGIVFAFAGKSVGGFPFRLDTLLDGVSFAYAGPAGQTAWRAEKLAVHALTYGRPLYVVEAAGVQSFEWPDASGGIPRSINLTPAIARASVLLRNGTLARFDLDLWQAEGEDASPGADAARTFSAARAQLHLLANPSNTIEVAVRIDEGRLGEGYHPELGGAFPLIELRGELMDSDALAGLHSGAESVYDAAEHWRQAGGKLEVEKLTLNWAGVKIDLQGTLGLDERHRPGGALQGSFDTSALVDLLTKGKTGLPSMGKANFSLLFNNGDVQVSTDSSLLGGAR